MIAALLLLAVSDTAVSLTADATAVRLSGVVRLTLAVEGAVPLRAEPGGLDPESAAAWKLTPDGPPAVASGRWEQRYVADPFVPGDAVRLGFAPVTVWAGGAIEPQTRAPAPLTIRVTTGVADPSVLSARPPTGVEALPEPPAVPGLGSRLWTLAATVAVLAASVVALIFSTRLQRRTVATPTDLLAGLSELPDSDFAHRLSDAVRDRLHTDALPARRLTTADLPAGGERALLERLDAVRFGGRPLTSADKVGMLDAARNLAGPVP